VIRDRFVTCAVCGTPVEGYERCFRCQQHRATGGLADVVAPLTYGIERTQLGIVLRHYKDGVSAEARAAHARVISRLLYLGIMKHQPCMEKRVGKPVSIRVTVPSLNRRPGVHSFTAIAAAMKAVDDDRLALVATPGAMKDRVVSARQFQIVPKRDLSGQHILVLDDTWTTGSNTQSAALTLRQAGAAYVSVMVVGRWLSQTYGKNAEFIKTRLRRDYDPGVCPVTGGACP
jgi:predicted amidophosphoribosyltransferase